MTIKEFMDWALDGAKVREKNQGGSYCYHDAWVELTVHGYYTVPASLSTTGECETLVMHRANKHDIVLSDGPEKKAIQSARGSITTMVELMLKRVVTQYALSVDQSS